jgi:hypothetical protein
MKTPVAFICQWFGCWAKFDNDDEFVCHVVNHATAAIARVPKVEPPEPQRSVLLTVRIR